MADLAIVYRPPSELIDFEQNSRTHTQAQIKQVKRSIKEFGFTNPILIDEHQVIVAGHARRQASIELKLEQVPTITLEGLSEDQKRAYVIADNQLPLNAGWNEQLLKLEIEALKESSFDISLLGFKDDAVAQLLGEPGKEPKDYTSYDPIYEVVVKCKGEAEQKEVYEMLTEGGYECRVLSM